MEYPRLKVSESSLVIHPHGLATYIQRRKQNMVLLLLLLNYTCNALALYADVRH